MIKHYFKKYWMHTIIVLAIMAAIAASLDYALLIAMFYSAGLFIFFAYAGMMTARFFYKHTIGKFFQNDNRRT